MSRRILRIRQSDVHRICSGQVIVTLASVVKELLENSLDAGAQNIEIILKNKGLDLIEVRDDGYGVRECDYSGLTAKHATSKITDFSDLNRVETFGFRGEALNSLCSLSQSLKFTVITKTADQVFGNKIEYDHEGHIASITPTPRERGTTVIVVNLFTSYPVRLKNLQNNIKKEFAHLLTVLQSYCLIPLKARISCKSFSSKGLPSVVVSKLATGSLKENIINIFGAKFAQLIEPFNFVSEKLQFVLDGYVSKVFPDNSGRASPDRQFLFINNRPCELPKVSKAINEVFRQFSGSAYPVFVLHINLRRDLCDVNVTPDKRVILLHSETALIDSVKNALYDLYQSSHGKFQVSSGGPPLSEFVGKPISCRTIDDLEDPPTLAGDCERKKSLIISSQKSSRCRGRRLFRGARAVSREKRVVSSFLSKTLPNENHVTPFEEGSDSTDLGALSLQTAASPCLVGIERTVKVDIAAMRRSVQGVAEHGIQKTNQKFSASIRVEHNELAESELSRTLTKDCFKKMRVLGQFNLGFIIAILDSDLFVIDQHASDEKYNFETLQKTIILQSQRLLRPKQLELSAAQEGILLANLPVFRKNGFDFVIDRSQPPGRSISLSSVPYSKSTRFDSDDVEELIFLLSEAHGSFCRPSKVRKMLASRACRQSVMIGTALTTKEMETIVGHMASIEQPWNCPHVRPAHHAPPFGPHASFARGRQF
ncbi:mismatch repair endonuclease PMS2-like isoform X2 [Zophobas morio]|uniref:mismatch repair endonuclease PMS2-like isoform X2 n=1 Tax=Zophobas morio TaxID=2755281 RepID=UPI003082F7CD